jgi:hypothetical protein
LREISCVAAGLQIAGKRKLLAPVQVCAALSPNTISD